MRTENAWHPRTASPSLVDVLEARGAETSSAPALTFLAGGETPADTWTFADLAGRARAVADALSRDAAPGDRALLLYPAGLDFAAAFLGCLRAGVIAVPAPLPAGTRSGRSRDRLDAIVADADPRVVLTTRDVIRHGVVPERVTVIDTSALPAAPSTRTEPHDAAPGDIAFLQYTSGSTAEPRGVMVTHGNLAANLEVASRLAGAAGRGPSVTWLPHTHDMGLIQGLLQPIWDGTPACVMAPASFLQRPARWLEAISRFRAVRSGGPNFAYELAAARVSADEARALDLGCWQIAFCGAEPVRAATMARFAQRFADVGFPSHALRPSYGLAEATLLVTSGVWNGRRDGRVRCGRPAPGTAVIVVDPASGRRLPDGEIGEIWVQGPGVAAGYWQRPELSRETFGATSPGQTGRFLRTGDLGYLEWQQLVVTGRAKDLIIVRGVKHYPQDLELTAELAAPCLRPGATVAFHAGDDDAGDRVTLVAEVDPGLDEAARPAAVDAIRSAIAREHGVQVHAVTLVAPGSVPKTTSGKLQRFLCRERWAHNELTVIADWRLADAVECAS